MTNHSKWLSVALLAIGGIAGTVAGYLLHDLTPTAAPLATQTVATQGRLSTGPDGQTIITLTPEEQAHSDLHLQPLAPAAYQPQILAYGTLQEDPANAVTLRAPFAGTLRASPEHPWPTLGDTLPSGTVVVGAIEPRFTPVEHLDLISRLSVADADVTTARSSLAAVREEYEADVKLNSQDKNVSDRTLHDARAKMEEQVAKLHAAEQTVGLLKESLAATTHPATAIPLTIPGDGRIVEVAAHPGESIDATQILLRTTRFDTLLAAVALAADEKVDPDSISIKITAAQDSAHPLKTLKIMIAPTVDLRTLGQTLLVQIDTHDTGLRPGGTVAAVVTPHTKPEPGVIIPRDAVVWHDGKAWVYLESASNQFKRREITTDRPLNDGWFIPNLAPNDRIVTQGAQQLLSEEFKPIIPPNVDVDG